MGGGSGQVLNEASGTMKRPPDPKKSRFYFTLKSQITCEEKRGFLALGPLRNQPVPGWGGPHPPFMVRPQPTTTLSRVLIGEAFFWDQDQKQNTEPHRRGGVVPACLQCWGAGTTSAFMGPHTLILTGTVAPLCWGVRKT